MRNGKKCMKKKLKSQQKKLNATKTPEKKLKFDFYALKNLFQLVRN